MRNPVIFGCLGHTLIPEEREFFEEVQPLGFILFKKNIKDKMQVKALIEDLKSTLHQAQSLLSNSARERKHLTLGVPSRVRTCPVSTLHCDMAVPAMLAV